MPDTFKPEEVRIVRRPLTTGDSQFRYSNQKKKTAVHSFTIGQRAHVLAVRPKLAGISPCAIGRTSRPTTGRTSSPYKSYNAAVTMPITFREAHDSDRKAQER